MFKSLFYTLIILFSFSTFAYPLESNYYLKGHVGVQKMNSVKEFHEEMKFNIKQEGRLSPNFCIGAGYYFNEYIRADLSYNLHYPYFETEANNFKNFNLNDQSLTVGSVTVKRKANIQSLMLNSYMNIIDNKNYNIYIGWGLGIAQIKERMSLLISGNIIKGARVFTFPLNAVPHTTKRINNLAYSLTFGNSIKLKSNVHMDTAYHWYDFGETKPIKNADGELATKNHYVGHNFTIGLRLDI